MQYDSVEKIAAIYDLAMEKEALRRPTQTPEQIRAALGKVVPEAAGTAKKVLRKTYEHGAMGLIGGKRR